MAHKKRLAPAAIFRTVLFATLIVGSIVLYRHTDYSQYITRERLSGTIDSLRRFAGDYGLVGTGVFAVMGCLAITINIPTVLIICFAVIIFGGVTGTLVSAVSIYLATTLIYFIAQLLGREFVEWAFGDRLSRVEAHLQSEGLMTVVYVRLISFMLPPVNWLLSLTNVGYRDLFLGTILGTAHMIILFAWLSDMIVDRLQAGESLNPFSTPELLLPITIGVLLFAALRMVDRRRNK
jgi:uncharacterized membrane protein YdjX (TVP38/TMEM64 family)